MERFTSNSDDDKIIPKVAEGVVTLNSIVIVLVTLIIDQVSKMIVKMTVALGSRISIIGDFMHLTYVKNTGAAFGMLKDRTWIFYIAAVLFFCIYLYMNFIKPKESSKIEKYSTSVIMGGVLGNVLDRIRFGSVVDFISVKNFSVFNLADCAITIGLAVLAWYILFKSRNGEEK